MKKKNLFALLLSLMLALSLAACGSSKSADETASTAPETSSEATQSATASDAASGEVLNLWDLPKTDTPDMSNTTWNLAGGYLSGHEMTQEELDSSLQSYGGKLQFTFDGNGGAKMVQGGGTLSGTYKLLDDGTVDVTFDNNGTSLHYGCIFVDMDGLTMIAISDDTGANGIYFVK